MVSLSKVLDRVIKTPAFVRKLKAKSGRFKVKASGVEHDIRYEKNEAGYLFFEADETIQLKVPK